MFEGDRFTVCDARSGQVKLFAAGKGEPPLRSFSEIGRKVPAQRVAFGMNAGMFDEDGRPIGLAIVDGVQKHRINLRKGGGNFHLLPNGVFLVRKDGSAAVVESSKFSSAGVAYATQSGPMLVIDGKLHPAFERDGTSRLIRNGVGVANGRALFVIASDPVSFGKFARFFRDGLKAPNALFFDGSVSSLWDPANGRQDSYTPLGPIVVAIKPAVLTPGRANPATP
jgi:prepilin-type processing-associated H-X9-DG protein